MVIEGIAACVATGVTKEAPNNAAVATTNKECFLFKVFPFRCYPTYRGRGGQLA